MISAALTGRPPFEPPEKHLVGFVYAHLHAPPPRPSQHNPAVPGAFDAVIARGMAKNPDDRYPSAGALAAAARAALLDAESRVLGATPPHPITRATMPLRPTSHRRTTRPQAGSEPPPPAPDAPMHRTGRRYAAETPPPARVPDSGTPLPPTRASPPRTASRGAVARGHRRPPPPPRER